MTTIVISRRQIRTLRVHGLSYQFGWPVVNLATNKAFKIVVSLAPSNLASRFDDSIKNSIKAKFQANAMTIYYQLDNSANALFTDETSRVKINCQIYFTKNKPLESAGFPNFWDMIRCTMDIRSQL